MFTETPPFSDNFAEVGYGSSNFINGLGSTLIIWIAIILFLGFGEILVRMLEHCGNHPNSVRSAMNKFKAADKRKIILRNLFETHMDTFINVVICCIMFVK